MGDFQVAQGLELQHLRRLSGALGGGLRRNRVRWFQAMLSLSLRVFILFDVALDVLSGGTKTEDSHHVCITQLHNFHSHRP